MRTLHLSSLVAAAILCFAVIVEAQVTPPTVVPRTFGVGRYAIGLDSTDAIDVPSNGLQNVAPGTKVYMTITGAYSKGAAGGNGSAWASATFTLTNVPSGSTASIIQIDALRSCFVADVLGTYTISVTATDNQGEANTATMTVNAANYVGVGGFASGTATPPNCAVCHSAIKDKWLATGHATAFKRKIDDPTGHFGKNCASCHGTGSTDPNAGGGGYLQLAASSTWVFPAADAPGNWDALIAEDPALAEMATISCENCHGPGSAHNAVTSDSKMVVSYDSENCIQCHDAPTHHNKFAEWRTSMHSVTVGEPNNPWHMNRGNKTVEASDCARCHTSQGFIDVMDQVAGGKAYSESFTNAPYTNGGNVGCATCHDPHDNTHEYQLRQEPKELCGSCHHIRTSSHGMHPTTQGPMIKGEGGREFPGYDYKNSGHSYMEKGCATCHMAEVYDTQYRNKIGDHTFTVIYDNETPDDKSDDVLNKSACETCHGEQADIEFVEETQNEIKALLEELRLLVPDDEGEPVSWTDSTLNQVQSDAIWNYYFVMEDLSYGIHNTKYATELLKASIAELTIGVEVIGTANSFSMGQNYPNPFNPSTAIQFSVPKGTNVKLAIYDVTGRMVNMLVNGYYNAGTYQVTWNGTTNQESRFAPSGVYFYRIEAGSFTQSRKMVMMK